MFTSEFDSEIGFEKWKSIPRLSKETMTITEKIDGTNACIVIRSAPYGIGDMQRSKTSIVRGVEKEGAPFGVELYEFAVQSRSRFITPENDNYGFAKWAYQNAEKLIKILGIGSHYGEWWGHGVQRGYNMPGKRFSLFNAVRWSQTMSHLLPKTDVEELFTVPLLYTGQVDWSMPDALLSILSTGSYAAPTFKKPEGIVVFLKEAGTSYKILLENDDKHKWEVTK